MGPNNKEFHREVRSRALAVCASVTAALRQDRLMFAFQPVVCAASRRIDYFECLLRMRDLGGAIVAGGEFIGIVEQLGHIALIDDYVLRKTVRELAGNPAVTLGLNISSLTACEGSWLQSLIALLKHRSDLACRLVVEITETAALGDIEQSARFVDALRGMGCRVALDDFGAGHTSLRHLQVLSLDTVKLDASLLRNLSESHDRRLVLRELIDLIKGFGCATVAEGIESAEDASLACEAGVGYLQGYYLGPPTMDRAWLGGGGSRRPEQAAPR